MKALHLFEGIGVELEYMMVQKSDLSIFPAADEVIRMKHGSITDEIENGAIAWSNELVLHVLELKTNGPAKNLKGLAAAFHQNVEEINQLLASKDAMLLPTAMHPWWKSTDEVKLWPHDRNEIYEKYNEIFNCKGHGWSNLQSTHINLPFYDDAEFAKLHAAIRMVLPLIPALAAASPFFEGKANQIKCNRLAVYKNNQAKVPSIAGALIPEPVYSKASYEEQIFKPMFKDIAAYDPDGILQYEWLNSRAAIARFDRNTIEIRIMDNQESPLADLGIIAMITALIYDLINGKYGEMNDFAAMDTQQLAAILHGCISEAEEFIITDQKYLALWGCSEKELKAKDLLLRLFQQTEQVPEELRGSLAEQLAMGSLSTRLLKAYEKADLPTIFYKLANCLQTNTLFTA